VVAPETAPEAVVLPCEGASPPSLPSRLILRFTRVYGRSSFHRWKHRHGCPCIFLPTCKEYLERAVVKYGAGRGVWMTWKRLRRCNSRFHGFYLDFP
jgi:putative component of membrane protein insertase Oxa1/YidC/SpoIIIJ protein YidD